MSDFKKLKVWQQAMDLALLIYRITDKFPPKEIYSLTSQMRRAAVSIPSNIAEGNQRNGKKEKLQFMAIALGSCSELETQSILANNLNYLKEKDFDQAIDKIHQTAKMLTGLVKFLKSIN